MDELELEHRLTVVEKLAGSNKHKAVYDAIAALKAELQGGGTT